MKRFLVVCVWVVSIWVGAVVSGEDRVGALEAYMEGSVSGKGFNGSVLVAQRGVAVLAGGYGMANFEHDVANTASTKFRIGSITKQFTSMAIMILHERGKLSVEDLVSEHLDDAPETWKGVTIHHLLTHTSGVKSFTGLPSYRRDMSLRQTTGEIIDRFRGEPLDFEPGEEFRYSNSGYFLLGVVIENVSGMKYEDFLRAEIFEPLGLEDTGYDRFGEVLKHRATGYSRWRGGVLMNAGYLDMSQPYAAGALYSTVEDLGRWDEALRRGELISKEGYRAMFKPAKKGYAYGWLVGKVGGHKKISHGGGINGFRTEIDRFPDEELCIVVLCNEETMNPRKVAQDLAAIMLAPEPPELISRSKSKD